MPASDFRTISEWLFSLKPAGTKYGIDRMRVLVEALGHPERAVPCIHIAGTNGKGSVAAMLEAILRAAGWRTGLYTSPHLVHLGERVQVNRRPLDESEIVAYVHELRPVAERIAAHDPELAPTFFEYATAMAWLQFQRAHCDVAVIEVGLGGRLDATNVVAPEVTVITSIGLDHCELLGDRIGRIAAEKAGIIKPHVPIVLGRVPREADEVIRAVAARCAAPVVAVSDQFGNAVARLPVTNLAGDYQRWNAATATLAARTLDARWRLNDGVIIRGLHAVAWPGRWDRRGISGRTVILDASHNPEGAEVLDANLRRLRDETSRAPIVVAGVLGAARAQPLLDVICRHARDLHLVEPKQPRACTFQELRAWVPASFRGQVVPDTVARIFPGGDRCELGTPDDVIVITGSIYLLGEVLGRLGGAAADGTAGTPTNGRRSP